MELEIDGEKRISDPGMDEIAEALRRLDRGEGEFVILGQDDFCFVQVSGNRESGYDLEYREGEGEAQYRAVDPHIPVETMIEVFKKYAAKDSDWSRGIQWDLAHLEAPEKSGCLGMLLLFAFPGLLGPMVLMLVA